MKGLIIIDEMHVPNGNPKVSDAFSEMLKKRTDAVLITPPRVGKTLLSELNRCFDWEYYNYNITLKTLTDALGSHVINVLKRTDRAAEYLANWKVQCRIEDNRCVVLRDGVVIGVGYYA